MKINSLICALLILTSLEAAAQKKNYLSLESGVNFGKANAAIVSSMTESGFGDYKESNSGWIALLTGWGLSRGHYPWERIEKIKYRVRSGHYINDQTAIEAGFGLTYYGEVHGYDQTLEAVYSNYLTIKSRINTFYVAVMRNNNAHTAGIGAGPALSLYKLTPIANGISEQPKNHLLPGGIITGYWNFLSKKSWYAGLRTECTLTLPVKIREIKVTNQTEPLFVSTFQSTKTGSFNGSVTLQAGVRF